MAGVVFLDSGLRDLRDPDARSRSIEMSKGFTQFLGVAEVAGGAAVMLGVLPRTAAVALSAIMLGAIRKKALVWKTGFWGAERPGWSYELMLVSMLSVVLTTGGGRLVLLDERDL
jgi:putative oxidoreductase